MQMPQDKNLQKFFFLRQKQPLPLHTPKIILIFPNQWPQKIDIPHKDSYVTDFF